MFFIINQIKTISKIKINKNGNKHYRLGTLGSKIPLLFSMGKNIVWYKSSYVFEHGMPLLLGNETSTGQCLNTFST